MLFPDAWASSVVVPEDGHTPGPQMPAASRSFNQLNLTTAQLAAVWAGNCPDFGFERFLLQCRRAADKPGDVIGLSRKTVVLRHLHRLNRAAAPFVNLRMPVTKDKAASAIVIAGRQIDPFRLNKVAYMNPELIEVNVQLFFDDLFVAIDLVEHI